MTAHPASNHKKPPADLKTWLVETVIKTWGDVGFSAENKNFIERLNADHSPSDTPYTRLRVQARQVYAFSHAWILSGDPQWRDLAISGFDFMARYGWRDDPAGWVHQLTPAGDVLDDRLDCYDLAFVLFSLAWFYRATGNPKALSMITATVDVLDQTLSHPFGGYYEQALVVDGTYTQPGTLPRRQNPHMHLLEAWMALYQATDDPAWMARAEKIMALMRQHFYQPHETSLPEFFTDDWQLAAPPAGDEREPGHYFEWVWLIHQYARLSGNHQDLMIAERLYHHGLITGIDYRPGHAFAAMDCVNSLGQMTKASRRLWPQTELLKAALIRYEQAGDQTALIIAHGTLKTMFADYLSADHGFWIDQIDADGRPIEDFVPSSSLYHLFLAISEWCRIIG